MLKTMEEKMEILNKFADILNKTESKEDKEIIIQLFMLTKDSKKDNSEPMSFEALAPDTKYSIIKPKIEKWHRKLTHLLTGIYMSGFNMENELREILKDMAKVI